MHIPRVVRDFATIFRAAGFQCHLVGGAVRDMLLGRPHTDYDVATDAHPAQVIPLFRRVIPTGIKHGTVTVHFKGTTFEVTTFRTEASYGDGRRPDAVTFTPSILDDLARRDFTINAIAYDLLADRVADPHEGRRDLRGESSGPSATPLSGSGKTACGPSVPAGSRRSSDSPSRRRLGRQSPGASTSLRRSPRSECGTRS